MCCRSRSMCSAEWIAALVDSVPQLVKSTSPGSQPSSAATRSRASVERLAPPAGRSVRAGRIAVELGEERHHLLDHGGIDLRGRVVVEIDEVRTGIHDFKTGAEVAARPARAPTEVCVTRCSTPAFSGAGCCGELPGVSPGQGENPGVVERELQPRQKKLRGDDIEIQREAAEVKGHAGIEVLQQGERGGRECPHDDHRGDVAARGVALAGSQCGN